MKKLILLLIASFYSLTCFAIPEVDINGLSVIPLNDFSQSSLRVYGHTSGASSAGICRIIIRSNGGYNEGFEKMTERFKFIHGIFGKDDGEATPIQAYYALMFKLLRVDYGFEYITLETKDGKSIGENIKKLFGDNPIAVIAGSCYPAKANIPG